MERSVFKKWLGVIVLVLSLGLLPLYLSSCSTVASGIEHAHLDVQAKMSSSIFLNPVPPSEKTVYIDVHNTSQVQQIHLAGLIAQYLEKKGYRIVHDPYKATFWVQANLLYLGKQQKHMTMAGMLAGGYGGALIGATMGQGWGKLGAASVGGLVGSAVGAVVGAAIHVDTYYGVVDVQIKQRIHGAIKSTTEANIQQGTSTTTKTTYTTTTHYQAYRTRIVVRATQTNLNLQKAIPVIEHKIAVEIAGIF